MRCGVGKVFLFEGAKRENRFSSPAAGDMRSQSVAASLLGIVLSGRLLEF
jgi:hypothetical protein